MISSPDKNKTYTDVHQILQKHIEEIADDITAHKDEITDYSLLGGNAGICLFYAYLSKIFPEKDYLQKTYDYLDGLVETLENEEMSYGMSAGIAGIAFVFQHLRNIGVLDKADDLNLSELDVFIGKGIESDYLSKNWDPLHGMVGLGIYFLERHKETGDTTYLEKITDHLAKMRTKAGMHEVWITPGYGKYSNDNYNFGMAHGMPGIISFLAQVYKLGIRQTEIEAMLSSSISYLLQNEITNNETSQFPTSIDVVPMEDETRDGRLAWCYGDLCVAFALIHCGDALKNENWKNKGIEVALKTTQRTVDNSRCIDSPICHGSVGIAHQYNRLYEFTGNELFKKAAGNWLQTTQQEFYKPGTGSCGYYSGSYNEEKNIYENNTQYGLLEGTAGIALVYLSILFSIKPDWDIILLTNV